MVSKAHGQVTLTAAEADVMDALRAGPADTGLMTVVVTRAGKQYQLVDRTIVKRLMKAGLVKVDFGGQASIIEPSA